MLGVTCQRTPNALVVFMRDNHARRRTVRPRPIRPAHSSCTEASASTTASLRTALFQFAPRAAAFLSLADGQNVELARVSVWYCWAFCAVFFVDVVVLAEFGVRPVVDKEIFQMRPPEQRHDASSIDVIWSKSVSARKRPASKASQFHPDGCVMLPTRSNGPR